MHERTGRDTCTARLETLAVEKLGPHFGFTGRFWQANRSGTDIRIVKIALVPSQRQQGKTKARRERNRH